jgi:hypothetical protein
MPLHFDIGPQDGPAMVRAGLQRLSTRANQINLDSAGVTALDVGTPHAVYDLHADEIANGGGLETAHATGYRYLVTRAGAAIAAGEVHQDAAGKPSLLANLNYGPYVAATAQALANVAASDQVRAGVYEARLLRFSAIYLVAVWLKPASGSGDIIVPLAPAPSAVQVGRDYTAEEFLTAIRPLAQQRMQKTDPPKVP